MRGFYWTRALELSEEATKSGELIPLKTANLSFNNKKLEGFEIRKLKDKLPNKVMVHGPKLNPFLPWEKKLEISLINKTHGLILNKYPVQKGHMLLISKSWKPQSGWLDIEDFSSLIKVNNDSTGLWFFNSSPESGASQPHRHIQLLPRENDDELCPQSNWFMNEARKNLNIYKRSGKSTFVTQRTYSLEKSKQINLYNDYLNLCKHANIGNINNNKPNIPYNLLIGEKWIALIRRSRESAFGFSINALGFAGYLLATKDSDLSWLESNGGRSLLKLVVSPNNN